MEGSTPQRLTQIGLPRALLYGLFVGGAAYLIATTYGPQDVFARLTVATVLAVGYVTVVHAIGVQRTRHRQG